MHARLARSMAKFRGRFSDSALYIHIPGGFTRRNEQVYDKPRGSCPFNNAITYQFHAKARPEEMGPADSDEVAAFSEARNGPD